MSKTIIFNLSLFLCLFSSLTNASPTGFQKTCFIRDSACLTEQTRLISKYFADGDAELGIEKMDKMSIGSVHINDHGLIYDEDNVEVEGLRNAVVNNISVDLDYKAIAISFETSLTITGDYQSSGMLLTSPVSGKGKTVAKIDDITIDMLCFYEIVQNKDGNNVFNLKQQVYGFTVVGGATHFFEKVLNNEEKSNHVHSILNNNWRIIVHKYGDVFISKIVAKIFTGLQKYLASQNLENFVIY